MNNGNANILADARRAVCADPKKTGVLTVLMLVLVVMAGRLLLGGGSSRPRAASASVNTTSGTVTGTAGPSAPAANVSPALQKWAEAPVPLLSRNLFSVRMEFFPVDGSKNTKNGVEDEGFWSKLEKSLALQADRMDKRENLVANYMAQAGKLKLESTMMGPQPRAMVNGELVGEGSVVAEFRVLKIEARRIVVEREGIRLEIQMK